MRVTNRVTNTALNRRYTSGVNDVHSRLNKAMNRVSSGAQYENAAENPLAYYEGKKMDNQYQDIESKLSLITDLQKRLEEQEGGAYAIQTTLAQAQEKVIYVDSDSNNGLTSISTVRDDLVQKAQFMVNELNSQYRDYYIYGGSDVSTTPFSLSVVTNDSITLTYSHTFPGDSQATKMDVTWKMVGTSVDMSITSNGANGDVKDIIKAMKEQGRVDVGYGLISDRNTLLDTYTGGMNLLTGLNSDAVIAGVSEQEVKDRLYDCPIGLLAQGILTCDKRIAGQSSAGDFSSGMNGLIDKMSSTHSLVSTVYSDLGNKYSLLGDLETKFKNNTEINLAQIPIRQLWICFPNNIPIQSACSLGRGLCSPHYLILSDSLYYSLQ